MLCAGMWRRSSVVTTKKGARIRSFTHPGDFIFYFCQAGWRGFIARRDVWGQGGLNCRRAASVLQLMYRRWSGRKRALLLLRNRLSAAALVIQCGYRSVAGERTKKRLFFGRATHAAANIQRRYRGYRQAVLYGRVGSKRRATACIRVQRAWRGFTGRSRCTTARSVIQRRTVLMGGLAEGWTADTWSALPNSADAARDHAMYCHVSLRNHELAKSLYLAALYSRRRTPAFLFSYAVLLLAGGAPFERGVHFLQFAREMPASSTAAGYAERMFYGRAMLFPDDAHSQLNYAVALLCALWVGADGGGSRGRMSRQESTPMNVGSAGANIAGLYTRRADTYFKRALAKMHATPGFQRRSCEQFRRLWVHVLLGTALPAAQRRIGWRTMPCYGRRRFLSGQVRADCLSDAVAVSLCEVGNSCPPRTVAIPISALCRAWSAASGNSDWRCFFGGGRGTRLVSSARAAEITRCDWGGPRRFVAHAICRMASSSSVAVADETGGPRIIVPAIETYRRTAQRAQDIISAVLVLQCSFRGFRGRRALSRRRSQRLALQRREAKLRARRAIRRARHGFVNSAAVRVQARWRGVLLRAKICQMHAAAVQIQRLLRGHLGRLQALEHERRLRMGPLVREVFYRGCVVSGRYLLLTVRQSGNNYRFFGFDLAAAEEYRGLVTHARVMEAIAAHPYGAEGAYGRNRRQQIRIWQHPRVLKLLLSKLMLVDPIKGLGEFQKNTCKKVLIVFLGSCHGGGRGILLPRSSWPSRMMGSK